MAWFLLLVAGLLEVGWATGLKVISQKPGVMTVGITIVTLAASMAALSTSMRSLPLGVAYPIWTGIGSVGSVLVGVLLYKEQIPLTSILGVAFLCTGMVLIGLKAH